jgi:hypothetical protein
MRGYGSLFLVLIIFLFSGKQGASGQFSFVNVAWITNAPGTLAGPQALTVAGDLLYAADYGGGLRIYNLTNPSSPANITNIFHDFATCVAVARGFAYVGCRSSLRIYDVSNPTKPMLRVSTTNSGVTSVLLSGNYLYLTDLSCLRTFDVSVPDNPIETHATNLSFRACFFAIDGNRGYLAGHDLAIFDLSSPSNPVLIKKLPAENENFAPAVAARSNVVYLPKIKHGLRIYDVTDPLVPTKIGDYQSGFENNANDVLLAKSYAIVQVSDYSSAKLKILDISNPVAPVPVGSTRCPGGYFSGGKLALFGNYIYLAGGSDGLRVYQLVPSLSVSRSNNGIAVSWPVALVNDYILQRNVTLDSNGWQDVSTAPTVLNNRNQIVFLPSSTNAFFRLRSP